ncbi:MAG TPA: hypothetical protein VLJ76_09320 [Gaiellaceae bacterium]|nr:hypothetical protein [Gaiellaceae bacterium]
MDYTLVVVPPGGGDSEYSLLIRDASFIPRAGDYVTVTEEVDNPRPGGLASAFKVRYASVVATVTGEPGVATAGNTYVEVEPVRSAFQTDDHRQMIEDLEARGLTVESYPDSGF